jgi:hypothetical protein
MRPGRLEATSGFEPLNRGFADLPLNHLGTSPRVGPPQGVRRSGGQFTWSLPLEDSNLGSRIQSPLSYHWTKGHRASRRRLPAGPTVPRTRSWSGRRGSNPRPQPWQGCALPTELLPPVAPPMWCREPDSNWRHRDFQSRALPTELSRPEGLTRLAARRRAGGYHGPRTAFNRADPGVARPALRRPTRPAVGRAAPADD